MDSVYDHASGSSRKDLAFLRNDEEVSVCIPKAAILHRLIDGKDVYCISILESWTALTKVQLPRIGPEVLDLGFNLLQRGQCYILSISNSL